MSLRFLLRALLLLVAGMLPTPDAAGQTPLAPNVKVETVATVPTGRIENLNQGPDGSIYISAVRDRIVYKVSPDGRSTEFANLSSTLAQITGIALTEDGGLVVGGSIPVAGQKVPGPGEPAGKLEMESNIVVLDKAGKVTATVPGGQKGLNFNGLAQLRPGVYLITEVSDTIYRFNLPAKRIDVWLKHDLLKGEGTGPAAGGANGLRVLSNWVYAAITGRAAIYRIPVGADGKPSGPPTMFGQGFRPDDFAVAKDGSVYGFGNGDDRNVMYRISPTGELTKVLEGEHGASAVGSTDGKWIYWASQADPEGERARKLYRVSVIP